MTENSQNPNPANHADTHNPSTPTLPDHSQDQSLCLAMLKRWYLIPIVFILIFPVSAFLIWKTFPPTYTTVGYISVEPVQIDLISGVQDRGTISNYEAYLNAQAYNIKTNSEILYRVVEDLHDKNLSIFDSKANLKDKIEKALEDETIIISVPRGNQVIQVSMKSTNSRDAELVVGAFINAYMDLQSRQSGQRENQQISLLEQEARSLMSSYQMHQERLNKLVEEQGASSIQELQSIMYSEQAQLQEKITDLESRLLDLQVRQSVLSPSPDPNLFPPEIIDKRADAVNSDPYVLSTTQALVQLKQELRVKKQQSPPDDPELKNMVKLESSLQADLTKYREEAGQKFDSNVVQILKQKNKYELALISEEITRVSAMLKEYQNKAEQNRADTIKLGRMDWEIRDMTTQMALDKENYDRIQQRIRDLHLQSRRPARIMRVGDPVSGPPESKRYSMLWIAALASLVLGLALTFLAAKLDKNTRPSLYPIEINTFIILCLALAIYCFIAARSAFSEQNLTAAGCCLIAAALLLALPTHALITHRLKKP